MRRKFLANKKGDYGDLLKGNAIYLILLVLFTSGMLWFLGNMKNATSMWGEAYSKEMAKFIDLAKPGDVIRLDVHRATQVALKNDFSNLDEVFRFDNINKTVYVKLSNRNIYSYPFFNDVIIVDDQLEKGIPGNILSFKIAKAGSAGGAP